MIEAVAMTELEFTAEQRAAIEQREGELLLDASAGSGKTSVLVERYVQAVLEDGVEVGSILAITFTDKAAAELRERIRARLRELGAEAQARAAESAAISTIHGFCARLLRTHALTAGIDPLFTVLDEPDAQRLADAAYDGALEELARDAPGAVDLIASYGTGPLRGATLGVYGELRSRGQRRPTLPELSLGDVSLEQLRDELARAGSAAAVELGALESPGARVLSALERVEHCDEVLAAGGGDVPLAELDQLTLPGGNGAALSTPVCREYVDALTAFRRGCERVRGRRVRDLLDLLLRGFGQRYEARKREASRLDFEDLELIARDLLAGSSELRDRHRARFEHVMVDEFQDTNSVQLELIDLLACPNLFTVGDAQQSIYAFRHADVELFEARGAALEQAGRRLGLATNFRSRPEILDVLNAAFGEAMGERFRPLLAGREAVASEGVSAEVDTRATDAALVELIVADKGAEWEGEDALAAPWRVAEARALARRIQRLIATGTKPGEIVVLTRATTDMRVYERALEDLEIPTYVIGGRGYWGHPQVVDVMAYLRALANPREEEALYTVLASPLVGASYDALVLLGAAARASERDPWWLLREPEGRLAALSPADRERLEGFADWFARERRLVGRATIDELISRALARTGYDRAMLALAGGERRLANVRKLMRLGHEYEDQAGLDLRGFVELARARGRGGGGFGARESEAPVESEALDAVRMMTIHRAKGLEFPVVCVADLGRGPWRFAPMVRIGRDGRLGLRLAEPGTSKRQGALDYESLGEEQQRRDAAEERRLFYVAMTRACERLVLSGAAVRETWPEMRPGTPMAWIGPAMLAAGVQPQFVTPEEQAPAHAPDVAGGAAAGGGDQAGRAAAAPGDRAQRASTQPTQPSPAPPEPPPVATLSYSALAEYERCGYRFYAERVLGLPATEPARSVADLGAAPGAAALRAAERGILVHALLEKLDFRRPVLAHPEDLVREARISDAQAEEIVGLLTAFVGSALRERLARCTEVRREERFAFAIAGDVLVTGALDVFAREPAGTTLIVDYKSDRLEGAAPEELVAQAYETQRLVYAVAALRAGARSVEVAHVFLEAPERPVTASFTRSDAARLDDELNALASGVLERRFAVTAMPHRGVCTGCPAEGGLCSWPLEMTRRVRADQLF